MCIASYTSGIATARAIVNSYVAVVIALML